MDDDAATLAQRFVRRVADDARFLLALKAAGYSPGGIFDLEEAAPGVYRFRTRIDHGGARLHEFRVNPHRW